jgi:ATP synthase protein I
MIAIDLPNARRLALGIVLGQAAVTVVVALLAWSIAGGGAAVSALLGGGISTVASLAMVALSFTGSAREPRRALSALYRGEAAKLAVVVVLFVVVLKTVRVVPLALFAGFMATLPVFWVALVIKPLGGIRPSVHL